MEWHIVISEQPHNESGETIMYYKIELIRPDGSIHPVKDFATLEDVEFLKGIAQ